MQTHNVPRSYIDRFFTTYWNTASAKRRGRSGSFAPSISCCRSNRRNRLRLSVFGWAQYKRSKAPVKRASGWDHDGYLHQYTVISSRAARGRSFKPGRPSAAKRSRQRPKACQHSPGDSTKDRPRPAASGPPPIIPLLRAQPNLGGLS
jgi:hypothetical protein